jgi:hypothetical protein
VKEKQAMNKDEESLVGTVEHYQPTYANLHLPSVVAPTPGEREGIDQLLRQAVLEVQQKNYRWAKIKLAQVLKLEPFNEKALLWMAYLTEELEPRIALLMQILAHYPNHQLAQQYLEEAKKKQQEVEILAQAARKVPFWEQAQRYQARQKAAYIPHLGEFLVEQGLITKVQLAAGLERLQTLHDQGNPQQKKLGQILVELGYLSPSALDRVLAQQQAEFSRHFKD